jgi:hypothetical protein
MQGWTWRNQFQEALAPEAAHVIVLLFCANKNGRKSSRLFGFSSVNIAVENESF